MYIVYADDQIIYHPELVDHGFAIYNPTITQEVNKSGSFQFTMPVTNSHYNDLQKMKTIIRVIQNGEEIFRGRILNDERDFYLNKVIYCEGELAFLLDSIVRPYDYEGTIGGFFRYLVAKHDEQVEDTKKFEIGNVTVLADTEFKLSITDYISTWSAFTSYLLDVYGGYIRIRLDNGHRYLDYVSSYGNQNTQVVSFGTNMLDLSQYISAENVFTRLIPLGATYSQEVDPSEINPDHLADGEEMLKLYTELIDNKGKTSSPKYIFSLRVGMDSQRKEIINGEEVSISHIIVDYTVKTNSGTGSWSGLDGSKVYANLKIQDIRNTARYVDQKERIVATIQKPSRTITTTEQTLLHWSGDVNTGSQVVTAEFINNYTASTAGALTVPISNSMSGVAQLQKQTYHKYTVATATADEHHLANSDVLFDSTAEGLFGKIVAVHTWDDVEDPAELLQLGEEYLADNISMAVKLDVSAVDLNLLNVNYEKFKIGDRIRVVSAPHRLDDYFVCSKVTLDLQHPENNTYGLGKELKTLTETQITAAKDIQVTQAMIEQINNSLDAAQTVVEQLNDIINTIYDSYADTKTIINNLDAAYADIDFANIGTAAIANLVANQALITSLDAAYAKIDMANVGSATIDNLVAGAISSGTLTTAELAATQASINFANIVDAAITNLLAKQILVDNVTVGVADINMANITAAGINRLKTNFADINFANITQAAINNLTAGTATVTGLNATYADINFANITTAALQNALVNTGLFNSLVVQDDVVVGGTLSADSITVGTLKAERLAIRGLDGIYYQLNLAKKNDGDITQQEWDAIDPDDLKEAFHGENIIANTITAKQIAAGTITAQKLAVLDATNVTYQYPSGGSTATKTMSGFISDVNGLTSTVSSVQTTVNSSVKSYTYRYFKSTSPTTQPSDADFDGASGSDTMPAREEGKYIWRRTTQTKNDNTTTKVYEMIQGADGDPGTPGSPGASVTVRSVQYQQGSSATTAPTGTWLDSPPAVEEGKYLWTKIEFSDNTVSYMVAKQGATGPQGPSGVSVTKVEPLYYLKSNNSPSSAGTAPAAPTAVVTSTAVTPATWTLRVPTYIEPDTENNVYYFYWTCQQTTYDTSPRTYSWSAVTPDSELNDIRVEMTRTNTLIQQTNENITLQASTTEELFSQAYDLANGAVQAVEDEKKARVSAINIVAGSVETLAGQTVSKSTYDRDKEAWNTAIEELQTSSLTVESGAITAMVADISNLQTTQESLATAFQVRDSGTYVYQSQILHKTVTTIFYQKNSNTEAPAAPTLEVTSTSTNASVWTKAIPTHRDGYYYWSCDQTKYTDGARAGTLECTTVSLLEEDPTETVTKNVSYPAIIESGYTKTTSSGMEIWVEGNEVAWNTAEGSGTVEFSIGESASDTARWQFKRSGDLLNISWHS